MRINRRKILALMGMSPALLVGTGVQARPENARETAGTTGAAGGKIETLNPRGTPPPIKLLPLAPRLDSLDGKTVYLVDTGFMGGAALLHQMEIWFAANMPNVKIVYRKKAGPYPEDDPVLWKEIKGNGNAAIMAIGHYSGCTPATISHCISVEKMGTPTVPVVTRADHDLAFAHSGCTAPSEGRSRYG
jgi:hypothetical protein